jgi:hypothetical protein
MSLRETEDACFQIRATVVAIVAKRCGIGLQRCGVWHAAAGQSAHRLVPWSLSCWSRLKQVSGASSWSGLQVVHGLKFRTFFETYCRYMHRNVNYTHIRS